MARNDFASGCIYIVHSADKSRHLTEGRLAFKFGRSRDVPKRLWNLNSARRETPRGKQEGAYGGVRDWAVVAVWEVPNMRQSEAHVGSLLHSRGNRFFEPMAGELFKADTDELELFIEHISQKCGEPQRSEGWLDDVADFSTTDYQPADLPSEDDEFDFDEIETDGVEEWRTLEELLGELNSLAEFFAKSKEEGWPYEDNDANLFQD